MSIYDRWLKCPAKDCEVLFPTRPSTSDGDVVACTECGRRYRVTDDASFDNGIWRDCSTLTPLPEATP